MKNKPRVLHSLNQGSSTGFAISTPTRALLLTHLGLNTAKHR